MAKIVGDGKASKEPVASGVAKGYCYVICGVGMGAHTPAAARKHNFEMIEVTVLSLHLYIV